MSFVYQYGSTMQFQTGDKWVGSAHAVALYHGKDSWLHCFAAELISPCNLDLKTPHASATPH